MNLKLVNNRASVVPNKQASIKDGVTPVMDHLLYQAYVDEEESAKRYQEVLDTLYKNKACEPLSTKDDIAAVGHPRDYRSTHPILHNMYTDSHKDKLVMDESGASASLYKKLHEAEEMNRQITFDRDGNIEDMLFTYLPNEGRSLVQDNTGIYPVYNAEDYIDESQRAYDDAVAIYNQSDDRWTTEFLLLLKSTISKYCSTSDLNSMLKSLKEGKYESILDFQQDLKTIMKSQKRSSTVPAWKNDGRIISPRGADAYCGWQLATIDGSVLANTTITAGQMCKGGVYNKWMQTAYAGEMDKEVLTQGQPIGTDFAERFCKYLGFHQIDTLLTNKMTVKDLAQNPYAYFINGNKMYIYFATGTCTVSGTPSELSGYSVTAKGNEVAQRGSGSKLFAFDDSRVTYEEFKQYIADMGEGINDMVDADGYVEGALVVLTPEAINKINNKRGTSLDPASPAVRELRYAPDGKVSSREGRFAFKNVEAIYRANPKLIEYCILPHKEDTRGKKEGITSDTISSVKKVLSNLI